MIFTSNSDKETKKIGQDLSRSFSGGDILLLYGELGAGKTTLVKGIAKGLGIDKEITSPTFSLMNIFEVKKRNFNKLIHIDTYRLEKEQELIQIGAEDYLGVPDAVVIVEWPEKMENLLKNKKVKKIRTEHSCSGRKITIED
ncbi:MAG: tRNA (adenosine(37)-N6)-threonylcarbamoyltransferase complex ATPase subunit type 1 TsaE [Patescibacteria group bacterium]